MKGPGMASVGEGENKLSKLFKNTKKGG